jgi:hypothetical protein
MAARRAAATKRNDMKYRIIGADGKTYGPVGLEQIRLWLAQGRADSRTPVFVDGTADWTFLGLLPELAENVTIPPPAITPARPGATRGTNSFATAGLVCGLLSWFSCCCCCCVPFNLLGLVFSIIALVQISAQPEPQEGRTLAIIGLVLSAANLLCGFGLGLLQLALHPANFNWYAARFE